MPLIYWDYLMLSSLCALSVLIFYQKHAGGRRSPLPPGPPRWPLIGCLPSMPNDENWKEFSRWGDQYGDVVYARVLNQDIIILNSYEVAVDLLERRSAIYSSRPHLVMAGDLVGWGNGLALLPYGDYLKRSRKLLHEGMNAKAMEELYPLLERETLKFIRRLADTPEELSQHIRQTAGSIAIKLTYGYDVKDNKDHFIVLADKAVDMFSKVTTPGAFLVDTFPLLRHLPWAPFKSKAKEWRKMLWDLVEEPMQFAKEQMQKGQTEPFWTMRWLDSEINPSEQSADEIKEREFLIKWAAMSIYGGGADTTVSSILSFFAAMVYYPSVQQTARKEIDRIIGTDRLPTYSDRSQLPYIEAVYKEVLRWQPVTPLGVPHSSSSGQDDTYQGMRIPKNSMIVPNIWRMMRDPGTYRNPSIFNPERFLGESDTAEKNPEDMAFGFGRRRCPGMNVAHSSIWMSIALTLAAYNITPAKGPDGEPNLPSLHYTNGTISHPEPFKCIVKPRSEKVIELLRDTLST